MDSKKILFSSVLLSIAIHTGILFCFTSNNISNNTIGKKGESILSITFAQKKIPQTKATTLKEIDTQKSKQKLLKKKPLIKTAPSPADSTIHSTKQSELTDSQRAELHNDYIHSIAAIIQKNVYYPSSARKMKQQGTVLTTFQITRDGKIVNPSIKKPSRFSILNNAALSTLERVSRVQQIPEEIPDDPLLLEVPIDFKLR